MPSDTFDVFDGDSRQAVEQAFAPVSHSACSDKNV